MSVRAVHYLNIIEKNSMVDCLKTCICNCVNKETFKCYNTRLCDKSDVQNENYRINKHSRALKKQLSQQIVKNGN